MKELNDQELEMVVGGTSQSNNSSNSNSSVASSSNTVNHDNLSVRHGQQNGAIIGGVTVTQSNDVHQRNHR
jgi:hypothetical protein